MLPQSLPPAVVIGAPPPTSEVEQLSGIAIRPPQPRVYKMHDLVTIVVDESSRQQAEQTVKTDKKYNNDATLGSILDPWQLLELRLRAGDSRDTPLIGLDSSAKFDGKGSVERNDRLQMKIQAKIIDVKPNGVLVLEARKFIDKNGETQETILAGQCRQDDLTSSNTVFSSQLANLSLTTLNTGMVDKAGKKGLIPRVLESIFAF